jgi:hypothetical protein
MLVIVFLTTVSTSVWSAADFSYLNHWCGWEIFGVDGLGSNENVRGRGKHLQDLKLAAISLLSMSIPCPAI